MSTKPQERTSAAPAEQERYMPGDPIPVPDAVEATTESNWALFSKDPLPEPEPEPDFLDTVPASQREEPAVNASTPGAP